MLERRALWLHTAPVKQNRRETVALIFVFAPCTIVGTLGALSCLGAGWLPMALLAWALSKNSSLRFQYASAGIGIGTLAGIAVMIAMSALGMLRE